MEKNSKIMLKLIIFLFAVSWIAYYLLSGTLIKEGNIALIPIKGAIVSDSHSFGGYASSTEIIESIRDAERDESIKAIVFEINSPGGSPVASKEIADSIKRIKKPAYAVIREVGASGAYWAASAADKIIVSDLSITGSIGVIASYIEFAGLLEKYNMTYQRFTAGELKDIGDPFKHMTQNDRSVLQKKLDIMHDYFISSVAENRNLPIEKVKELATGEFYLGIEAVQNSLADEIGDLETTKAMLRETLNITSVEYVEYSAEPSLIDLLSGVIESNSFNLGKGIGSALSTGQYPLVR